VREFYRIEGLKERRGPGCMWTFIAGVFVGSLAMLVTMSLMFVAKQADEQRGYITEAEGGEWEKRKRG
jgi:Protein of unknown function (DUF3789)